MFILNHNHPISKLTKDLLWAIFAINAYERELPADYESLGLTNPIDTIRFTSQVCREWRDMILTSPSIWGKLLYLQLLNQRSDYWRNEVLSRSGTSPLHIQGPISGSPMPPMPMQTFFYTLLNDHWDRIESVAVFIDFSDFNEIIRNVMARPAPHLRKFKLHVYNFPRVYTALSTPLFANGALSLQSLTARGIHLTLDPIWIYNLRELTLGTFFDIAEIFKALQQTPLLETLSLYATGPSRNYQPPHIRLPRLQRLRLQGDFQEEVVLLRHIEPGPGCSLEFTGIVEEIPLPSFEDLKSSEKPLSKILQSYFHAHPPRALRLQSDFRSYFFETPVNDETFFEIGVSAEPLPDYMSPFYYNVCTSSHFATVVELQLHLTGTPNMIASFKPLASSLQSLRVLETTESSITTLINSHDDTSFWFPNLHVLKILGLTPNVSTSGGDIGLFLERRQKEGSPVAILQLAVNIFYKNIIRDMEGLEDILGLTVRWTEGGTDMEYRCGSGHPDRLRFQTNNVATKDSDISPSAPP